MITGIDPKVDYVFEKLFGSEANRAILVDLLHAVLKPPPDARFVELELLNPFNEKDADSDKLSVVDVKARDQQGRLYDIEMQNYPSQAYLDRVLYYWSQLFSRQMREGDDYRQLRATISISFVNGVLFPGVPDYHLDFRLRSAQHPGLLFSELQWMHVVELPKFERQADELADPLDAWCYFLKNAARIDADELPRAMNTPAVKQAMEVLHVISQTDLEYERYLAKVRWERDQRARVYEAELAVKQRDEVRKELDEARKDGPIATIHAYQRVLKMPTSPRDELLVLSLEDLEARAKSLQQQLGVA